MDGDFIFGFILGAGLTALAMKGKLDGFKDLVLGVWEKITGKGGKK